MSMTAEQIRTELTERLPEIERRLAWLTREAEGMGRGVDTQRRMLGGLTQRVGELRTILDLPPAPDPVFDEAFLSNG